MAKTSSQLFLLTLRKLLVVGSGQTASAEDTEIASDALQPLLAELASSNVAYIPVDPVDTASQDIPDEFFNVLADLLADDIAPHFGIPQANAATRQQMLNRMRLIASSGPKGFVLKATYF